MSDSKCLGSHCLGMGNSGSLGPSGEVDEELEITSVDQYDSDEWTDSGFQVL